MNPLGQRNSANQEHNNQPHFNRRGSSGYTSGYQRCAHNPTGLAQGLVGIGSQKNPTSRPPGREILDPHRLSPMNVNLARRNGFPSVGQTQDQRVTEAPELTVVFRPSTSGTTSGRSSSCWTRYPMPWGW